MGCSLYVRIPGETQAYACQHLWQEGSQTFLDGGGHPNHHRDRRRLFPQQAPQGCLYQEEVSLFWSQGVWEEESRVGGHLPLLWSAISECSFQLLPHLEAPGTRICMQSL